MNQPLRTLRQLITQHFDRNELHNLYFDLGLDVEEARDERKSELARHLIEACQRRGQLPDLLLLCQQQRPHVNWPDVQQPGMATQFEGRPGLPSFRRILKKAFMGGLRGVAAGAAVALVAAIVLALVFRLFHLFVFVVPTLLGGIIGIPFGLIVGLIEIDERDEWRLTIPLGGVGGLLIGLLASITLVTLLSIVPPTGFFPIVIFGTGIGLCAGMAIWAVQGLEPHLALLSKGATPSEEKSLQQKPLRRYAHISNLVAGAVVGSFTGAVFGLIYDVFLEQDPFWGVVTSSIGIPPFGHFLLVQDSERPYVSRSYVGRVVGEDGLPVNEASVTLILQGIPIEASTDRNGVYEFSLSVSAETLSGRIVVQPPSRGVSPSSRYQPYESEISIDPRTTVLPDIQLAQVDRPFRIPSD